MATSLMPVEPAVTGPRTSRLLSISANLLPEEVIAGRRTRRVRAWVIVLVILVALACGAWTRYAERNKQEADAELTAATGRVVDLQREKNQYAPVVKLRDEGILLKKQLSTVMANDLDWSALIGLLRTTGPEGIEVDGISGKLASAADSTDPPASGSLPGTKSSGNVGTVTVTGTAPDKKAVAAYVDALAQKTTIANPYVTSVTTNEDKKSVTFSVTVEITKTALCGRFGTPCPSSGGK